MPDSQQAILTGDYDTVKPDIEGDLNANFSVTTSEDSVLVGEPINIGEDSWTSQIQAGSQVYLNQKFGRDQSQHDLNLSKDRAKDIKKLMRSQCIYESPNFMDTVNIQSNDDYLDYFPAIQNDSPLNVGYDLIEKYKTGVGNKITYWTNEDGGTRIPFATSNSPNSRQDIIPILTRGEDPGGNGNKNWNYIFNSLYYPSPDQVNYHNNIKPVPKLNLRCISIDRENPDSGCSSYAELGSSEDQYKCLTHNYGNTCRLTTDLNSRENGESDPILTSPSPSRNLQLENDRQLSDYNNFKGSGDLGNGLYGRWDSVNNLCGNSPMKCSGTLKDSYISGNLATIGVVPESGSVDAQCSTYFSNIIKGQIKADGNSVKLLNSQESYDERDRKNLCEYQFAGTDLRNANETPLTGATSSTGCTYSAVPEYYTDLNLIDKCSVDDLYEKLQDSGMRKVDLEKIEFTNGCNKRKIGYDIEHVCANSTGKYLSKSQTVEKCVGKKVDIMGGNGLIACEETDNCGELASDCGENNSLSPCSWIPVLKAKEYVDEDSQCNLRCKDGAIQNGSQPYCKSAPDYSYSDNHMQAGYLHPYLNPEWELNNFSCTAIDETKCSGEGEQFKKVIGWDPVKKEFETQVNACGAPNGGASTGGPPPPPTPTAQELSLVPGTALTIFLAILCIAFPGLIAILSNFFVASRHAAPAPGFAMMEAIISIILMLLVGTSLSFFVSNNIYSSIDTNKNNRYFHIFVYVWYSLFGINIITKGWTYNNPPQGQFVSLPFPLGYFFGLFGVLYIICLISAKNSASWINFLGLSSSVFIIIIALMHNWKTHTFLKGSVVLIMMALFLCIYYISQPDGYINNEGFGLQEGFTLKNPSDCYTYSDCKEDNNCVWDEILSIIDGPQDYNISRSRYRNYSGADEMLETMYGFIYLINKYDKDPSKKIYFDNSEREHKWGDLFDSSNTNPFVVPQPGYGPTNITDLMIKDDSKMYRWVESWTSVNNYLLSDNSGNKKNIRELLSEYNLEPSTLKKVFWYYWNIFHDGTNGQLRSTVIGIDTSGTVNTDVSSAYTTARSYTNPLSAGNTNSYPPSQLEIRKSTPLLKLIFKDWLNNNLKIDTNGVGNKFEKCEYTGKVCTYGVDINNDNKCKEYCDTDELLDYSAGQCMDNGSNSWAPSSFMGHPEIAHGGSSKLRYYGPNFQRLNCEFNKIAQPNASTISLSPTSKTYQKVGCIKNHLLNHNVIPGESCGDYLERVEASGYNITCNDAVSRSLMSDFGKGLLLNKEKDCYTQFEGDSNVSEYIKHKVCGSVGGTHVGTGFQWINENQIDVLDEAILATMPMEASSGTNDYLRSTNGISPVISCCAELDDPSANSKCKVGNWITIQSDDDGSELERGYCSSSPSSSFTNAQESSSDIGLTKLHFCAAFTGARGCPAASDEDTPGVPNEGD